MDFLDIRLLDILDMLIVAILLYEVYMALKGTVALNVFFILFTSYLVWMIVRALNMQLLGSILGQVMGVGVIAVLIVFQQEMKRFFIMLSNNYFAQHKLSLDAVFSFLKTKDTSPRVRISQIVTACRHMAMTKTGALIIITKNSQLGLYADTGEAIDAETNSRLIETLFFKNSPLHDGAVIVEYERIRAAGCVLPISNNQKLPKHLGLRHRAALGITETTDAIAITVSEETGYISIAQYGHMEHQIPPERLTKRLRQELNPEKKTQKTAAHERIS